MLPRKDNQPPVKDVFDQALRLHQSGDMAGAEALYRQVLALDAQHADSLHLLGVLAAQDGRHDDAVDMITRAIAVKGDSAVFHNNLGTAYKNLGRLAEAEASYRRVTELSPGHAGGHFNLGELLAGEGRPAEAAACFEQACALRPDWAEACNNLGTVLRKQDRLDEAVAQYGRAIVLNPDFAEAFSNLGNALKEQDRLEEAIAAYERAVALRPDFAEGHYNLAIALRAADRVDDAIAHYERAIALKSDVSDFHNKLGEAYREKYRYTDAMKCHRRAIALAPDNAEAHNNLGIDLNGLGWLDEAIICYQKTIELDPRLAIAHSNLGGSLKEQGHLIEAMACFRRCIALIPEYADTYSNLLLTMIYAASVSPEEVAQAARDFGKRITDHLPRDRPFATDKNPDRRLRIGYVSPDFRNHAVNYFFEPLLKLHDRARFEIFAYRATRKYPEDHVTARLKQEFDHWRDISVLKDDAAADLIEADKIDILIDLAGHTGYNRLPVFGRKPAPVQVTWLGYPATTGVKAIDYRITDNYAEPVGMTEHLNVEKLWRLPDIFCCYQAHENSPAVIDHPPFADNGYITFGCFNNFTKVTDPVMETWARILERVPKSRLLLEINGITSPPFRASVEERLRHAGLPASRVILEPRRQANQFVLYNRLDIALDPFPCVGGTTSFDAMWMGVPFVTLAGRHFTSRMGVTILTNAGLPELIAQNLDEYVDIAVALALDQDRLRKTRHNLRDRVAKSPLMDQEAFARNMDEAYREMWRKYCSA